MASQPWRSFKILVVSPTPTHPQDHGNRKRIFEICSELKRQGAHLHFVHFPSERDWRHSRPARFEAQMREAWDEYDLVAPSRPLHPDAIGQDHTIDEWADPGVASFVAWACRVSSYDAVIVNYTWMSFCLDGVPQGVFKICDTHDVFGGRRELLEANGIAPEFFHTTRENEASGLRRADLVWAIKDAEQRYFEHDLGLPNCLTMLHAEPATGWWQKPSSTDGWLRAGVIGARNNINRRNLEDFLKQALPLIRSYMAPAKIVIAGGCSDDFKNYNHPNVEVIGRVEDVADFYRLVDVVIVPMQFSTGLKIKAAEALASGAPVIAHAHAMEGYPTREKLHLLDSFKDMALELVKLAFDPTPLDHLAAQSRTTNATVQHSVLAALEATRQQIIGRSRKTICVIAPMAALSAGCLLHDQLYATFDYLRFATDLVLFLYGEPTSPAPGFFDQFEPRIRVFAEPALKARLADVPVAEDWMGIELADLLDSRGYDHAYLLGDCRAHFALGTGSLRRIFVRYDAVAVSGGDADALIDLLRPTAELVLIGSDAGALSRWRGKLGIVETVPIAFRRHGRFLSFANRPPVAKVGAAAPTLVVLGDPSDPIAEELLVMAGKLGTAGVVFDPADPAAAAELSGWPGADANPLSTVAVARLLVDLTSGNMLAEVLGEAAQRAGIPVIRPLRGRMAASQIGQAPDTTPVSLAQLLRVVAEGLGSDRALARLQIEVALDVAARTAADSGWTWVWGYFAGSGDSSSPVGKSILNLI